jgi:hypothetical protein
LARDGSLPRWFAGVLVLWLAAALGFGAAGTIAKLRPPAPQLVLVALTAALLLAGALVPGLRRWARAVDPRVPVALHLSRFVGAYFLVLYEQGRLPWAFAVPGGWGDIAVASLALVLLVAVSPSSVRGRRLFLAWNALGSIDILAVVATATSQALARPESMQPLLELPLSLLPTYLVPLILASHALIFVRLRAGRPAGRGAGGGLTS